MPAVEMREFLREYTRSLREGDAALFVGAGISRAAGFVDWKQLLKDVAQDLELDIDRETDLVALAQYHVNHRGGRDRLNQLLIDEFLEDAELTPTHNLIASLPVHTIWTTNYDDLLETALTRANKRVDTKRRQEDFALTRRRTDVTVYKMHGDRTNPAEAVLTKGDYEAYDATRELFTIALKGDLAQKTFLFLGFSFSDPNVMYILARVKQLLEANGRKHYCVLKAPKAEDHNGDDYQSKRFTHWLADLHRYNVQPILIDDYKEVPNILTELVRRSHLRDIFISGSAADYEPLGKEKFTGFCCALSAELIKKEFNIISGFGLGVGDSVIFGATQSLQRNDDERLQLWPFPQQVPAGADRAEFWRQYRERMISNCGVCIVIAGNKTMPGAGTVAADGVRQEVAIALSQKKAVIPVGATGSVARDLWEKCKADPKEFLGDVDADSQLQILGDTKASVSQMVQAVIDILRLLDK